MVAFGHFADAALLKLSTSLLFHELKSSSPSVASSRVMLGYFKTPTTSFSHCSAESGASNFRTLRADKVRLAQSPLFFDRYSSLYLVRFTDAGNKVNSDLMTSADFSGTPSKPLSRASLNRTICSWTLECSMSSAAAANRHFRARRYFSVQKVRNDSRL